MSKFKVKYSKYILHFNKPSGTSQGVLTQKESWFIFLSDSNNPERTGIGECSLIRGLSPDDNPEFERILDNCCRRISESGEVNINLYEEYPAIQFGLETALKDLNSEEEKILFPSEFTEGKKKIPINGLVWMGDAAFMEKQIGQKLKQGFTCLKLKIGAIHFEEELKLLKSIRKTFSSQDLELRVDANGAFQPDEAIEKLKTLAEFEIHSIEQPIRPGQLDKMAEICSFSALPVALDEELIGVMNVSEKVNVLDTINPRYIILKPSLVGGFAGAKEWIELAQQRNIGWWVTSALESNIGLNAIAQWTYTLNNTMLQGLGTGQLYTNNIDSPLYIENGFLGYSPSGSWQKLNI